MSRNKRNVKNLNNYKIEHLERRELFSVDAPIDLSDNNAVDNQLSALYVSLDDSLDSSVLTQTNTIGYHIKDNVGNTFTNISDLLGEVSTGIKANIQSAFAKAKAQAVEKLEDNGTTVNASTLLGYHCKKAQSRICVKSSSALLSR